MNTARLTVQVVLWNHADVLPSLLRTLQQQTLHDIQYVFIDNHSSDNSVELVRNVFPNAVVIQNQENRGFSAAHNQGLRIQTSEYVALVNPDIVLTPDVFTALLSRLDTDPSIGSTGTKLLKETAESGIVDSAGILATRYREFLNRGEGERDQGQFDQPGEVFGLSGALAVFRRAALDSIADGQEILDEDLFAYKDDVDLAWRLRLRGWKNWYIPKPVAAHTRSVRHESSQSVFLRRKRKSVAINRMSFRNHWIVLLKNDRFRSWFIPWPRMALYEAAKFLFIAVVEPRMVPAIGEVVRLLPKILRKRRHIQRSRTVSPKAMGQWFV